MELLRLLTIYNHKRCMQDGAIALNSSYASNMLTLYINQCKNCAVCKEVCSDWFERCDRWNHQIM